VTELTDLAVLGGGVWRCSGLRWQGGVLAALGGQICPILRLVGEGTRQIDMTTASHEGRGVRWVPGHGLARWEKEVGPAQQNSIVSDLNQFFN
jgi:hypothetical protein